MNLKALGWFQVNFCTFIPSLHFVLITICMLKAETFAVGRGGIMWNWWNDCWCMCVQLICRYMYKMILDFFYLCLLRVVFFFTPSQNCGGVIFTSVCLSVFVCLSVSEQNANRTATPILTRSLLNSCLLQSLKPYRNCWPLGKAQGHSDVISIFPW